MSDNRRVYRTIRKTILQLYPGEPKGNNARMLNTLAALVSGIVLGRSCQLPTIARKAPGVGTVNRQLYKAWGESRGSGAVPTKYTYTGQYNNTGDFGLLFFRARWYDSVSGRFAQADSIIPNPGDPQSYDRYAYTRNNPINRVDPSGHLDTCGAASGFNEQCKRDNLWTLDQYKFWITFDYGVRLVDGDRTWDLQNAKIVYQGLGDTYSPLFNTQGVTFTLHENPDHYHGVTTANNIDFQTSTTIPFHNFYHEFGHLIDARSGNQFSNALAAGVHRASDDTYWFGGSGEGVIDWRLTLKSESVSDPFWSNPIQALQTALGERGNANEQWADMYANYISGNIDRDKPGGSAMFVFVQGYINPPPYIPGGGFLVR